MSDEHSTPGQDLVVRDLRVAFPAHRQWRGVVRGLSFTVRAGRSLALVGESGSGKSVTARSVVGLAGESARVTAEELRYGDRDLRELSSRQWRTIRGRDIGFVLQDALVSLDPLRPVGKEIEEALRLHGEDDRTARTRRAVELLAEVGVPEPEVRSRQRPHELSGGLRQRALIASAIALSPGLVITDEPTTALDATVAAQVLNALEDIKQRGNSLLVISHDLSVVSRIADEIAVVRDGEIVEQGPARQVLTNPEHEYTQALLDAVPSSRAKGQRLSAATDTPPLKRELTRSAPADGDTTVLELRNATKRYRGPDHRERTVVDDVSFTLRAGQVLGVVGESGSGKTTTARIALGLVEPEGGSVRLLGRQWNGIPERHRRPHRRNIGVVYQDPLSSFDPRWDVGRILGDALHASGVDSRDRRRRRTSELLDAVGLAAGTDARYPLHLSGGQRQRVAIARALASEPSVLVCDEPVSALDVSVQAQVLDLLADLQRELGVAYLFISHDLGVIRHVSDDVLVMRHGRVVESGPVEQVFHEPEQPYTEELLNAIPQLVTK